MVQALQVDLVVQDVQMCLFLENLVTRSNQDVLAAPLHLLVMIKNTFYMNRKWAYLCGIDELRQVPQIYVVPLNP